MVYLTDSTPFWTGWNIPVFIKVSDQINRAFLFLLIEDCTINDGAEMIFLPWCFASQWILIDLLGSFLEYPQRILVRRFLMPFLRNRCTSWSWSLFAMHRQIWWNSCHYVLSIYSTWPPLFIGLTLIYTKAVNSP